MQAGSSELRLQPFITPEGVTLNLKKFSLQCIRGEKLIRELDNLA
jgi:hypothetical protein